MWRKTESSETSALEYLTNAFAAVSEIDRDSLSAKEEMGRYGINSLMIAELNRMIERDYGPGISKSLFSSNTLPLAKLPTR